MRPRQTRVEVVLVCDDTEVASWPLATSIPADLATVAELARLQLVARRLGCSIGLRDAGAELLELLDLVGLGEVLTGAGPGHRRAQGLGQVGGEVESGEQAGIDEVVVPDDPVP